MKDILNIARRYDLAVIEDAAQSLGARQQVGGIWRTAGSMGDIGCFSFYPSKNLGALGDGGIIVTSDRRLRDRLLALRDHGARRKNYHDFIGLNSRLDELQAAFLLVKLGLLKQSNRERAENFRFYNERLRGVVTTPRILPGNKPVFHQYVIRTARRNELQAFLKKKGIATEVYYPLPLHLQPCYRHLGYRPGDFPAAEQASRETLALPIDPMLTDEERQYVADCTLQFFKKRRPSVQA